MSYRTGNLFDRIGVNDDPRFMFGKEDPYPIDLRLISLDPLR
jgi:hypothetical protein